MAAPRAVLVLDVAAPVAVHFAQWLGCKFTPRFLTESAEASGCDPNNPPFPGFTLFGVLETPQGDCFCVWTNGSQTAFTQCGGGGQ